MPAATMWSHFSVRCKDIEYLSDVDFEQSDEDMEDLEQILKPRRAPSPSNGGGGSPKGHTHASLDKIPNICAAERPPDKKSRREHQRSALLAERCCLISGDANRCLFQETGRKEKEAKNRARDGRGVLIGIERANRRGLSLLRLGLFASPSLVVVGHQSVDLIDAASALFVHLDADLFEDFFLVSIEILRQGAPNITEPHSVEEGLEGLTDQISEKADFQFFHCRRWSRSFCMWR